MGCVPDLLPGRRRLSSNAHRSAVEKLWQVKLSPEPGLDMVRFIESVESGAVKAAYIMGENIIRSLPQQERVEAALKKLDFLVVQDIFYDRTAKLARRYSSRCDRCRKIRIFYQYGRPVSDVFPCGQSAGGRSSGLGNFIPSGKENGISGTVCVG